MTTKYDIFISYRRIDSEGRTSGRDIARTIKLELEKRKYKVFFDYSEIKDNEFEKTILPAVQNSRIFLLVLSKDALLRCCNEDDWVRKEIETAIKSGSKIVPVNPDNSFNGWPSNLPESLKPMTKQQISEISMNSLFETSIDKLEKDRLKSPPVLSIPKPSSKSEPSKQLFKKKEKSHADFLEALEKYQSESSKDYLYKKNTTKQKTRGKSVVTYTNFLATFIFLTILILWNSMGTLDNILTYVFSLVGILCFLYNHNISETAKDLSEDKSMLILIVPFILILDPIIGIVIGAIVRSILAEIYDWKDKLCVTSIFFQYFTIVFFAFFSITKATITQQKENVK